jgi:hypothetical protein
MKTMTQLAGSPPRHQSHSSSRWPFLLAGTDPSIRLCRKEATLPGGGEFDFSERYVRAAAQQHQIDTCNYIHAQHHRSINNKHTYQTQPRRRRERCMLSWDTLGTVHATSDTGNTTWATVHVLHGRHGKHGIPTASKTPHGASPSSASKGLGIKQSAASPHLQADRTCQYTRCTSRPHSLRTRQCQPIQQGSETTVNTISTKKRR